MNIIRNLFRHGGQEREGAFVTQAQEHLAKKENVPIELKLNGKDIVILNNFTIAWRRDNRIEDMTSVLVTRFQEVVGGEGFSQDDFYSLSFSEREIMAFGQKLLALAAVPEDGRIKLGYPKYKAGLINQSIQNIVNAYKESTGFVSQKLRSTYLLALRGIGDVEYSDEDDDEDDFE